MAPARPSDGKRDLAWRGGSLRARLIAIVIAADLVAALATGTVIVGKARIATRLEIASAMELAQSLVADTIKLMRDATAPVLLRSIDLHFQSVRHVRINVVDAAGQPVEAETTPHPNAGLATPWWFERLVSPPIESRDYPIVVQGRLIGTVTLVSQPADEISEAWGYAHTLIVTSALLNVLALVVMILVFGRVLAPLEALAGGLRGFERKDYAVRLPKTRISELATITSHFNRTAAALSAAEDGNRRLNRELLTAQDDERRRTALELHDEVGPCLFALEANATSIMTMAQRRESPPPDLTRIQSRATDVVSLVERLQHINRRVLDRLRPLALGQIPLRESLVKLVVEQTGGDDGPVLDHAIGPIRDSYDYLVDLTIYRCVQEGLFNAVRHAQPKRVRLHVAEVLDQGAPRVVVTIADDGTGLPEPGRQGRGIRGMRERVEALGGTFCIDSSADGTRLAISIPIEPARPDAHNQPNGGPSS